MHTFGRHGRFRPSPAGDTARNTGRNFVQLFGPVVYALARKRGLEDAAAADLMREVLTSTARDEQTMPGGGTIHARLVTATRAALVASGRGAELGADWEGQFERQLAGGDGDLPFRSRAR